MKLPKLTILSIACLSGLVSCYPVTPINPIPSVPAPKPSGLKTPAELKEAAKKRTEAANAKKTALQRSKDRLEREERKRHEAEKKEAAAYREKAKNKVNEEVKKVTKPTIPKPPVVSNVVKIAAPVPGKPGFVYNPFTHNQVNVKGIPSGTKVRDPHDANQAHVFKVP